jgi:hypothetical protein
LFDLKIPLVTALSIKVTASFTNLSLFGSSLAIAMFAFLIAVLTSDLKDLLASREAS